MNEIFAERLRVLRLRNNETQAVAAEKCSVSKVAYVRYEAGRIPTAEILASIADHYEVTVDYLIGRADDPQFIHTDTNVHRANLTLDDTELHLITDYRSLSSQGQEYIRQQMYMAKSIYTAGDTGFTGMETAVK